MAVLLVLIFQLLFSTVWKFKHKGGISIDVYPSRAFPVAGTKFQVRCYADGSNDRKMPNARFEDINNKVYTNTSRRYITVEKNIGSYQENLIMTWDPITLADMATIEEQGSTCATDSIGAAFIVFVIPKESKPRFAVSPRKPVSGNIGADMTFDCHAAIDVLDKIRNISIIWAFTDNYRPLPKNQSKIKEEFETRGRSVIMRSQLTIQGLKKKNVGTYHCIAMLEVVDARNRTYHANTDFQEKFVLSKVVPLPLPSSAHTTIPNWTILILVCLTVSYQIVGKTII